MAENVLTVEHLSIAYQGVPAVMSVVRLQKGHCYLMVKTFEIFQNPNGVPYVVKIWP